MVPGPYINAGNPFRIMLLVRDQSVEEFVYSQQCMDTPGNLTLHGVGHSFSFVFLHTNHGNQTVQCCHATRSHFVDTSLLVKSIPMQTLN